MSVARTTAAVHDLVIVSDRLPTSWSDTCAPAFEPPSASTLRAGFWPLLNARRGAWVGWSGLPAGGTRPALFDMVDTRCAEVSLSIGDVAEHLRGHSDAALWPLYHDALDRPTFHQQWWQAYQRVNQRYARTAAGLAGPTAQVWIHGYQLQLVPATLRAMRPDLRIGFHLDTPFPPYQLLAALPTNIETVAGFLGADTVGFQDSGSARNLARLCAETPGMVVDDDHIFVGDRLIRYGAVPTGVDATEIARLAGLGSVQVRARQLRSQLGDPQTVLLAVDRMDTSNGIEQRLAAFDELLRSGQLDRGTTVLVQVVLPDAELTPARAQLRSRIEQQIARINGRHSRLGGAVVHYVHQGHNLGERVALYLASDVLTLPPCARAPVWSPRSTWPLGLTALVRWYSANSPALRASCRTPI
jgi:trehalose 6-phosphate synthase